MKRAIVLCVVAAALLTTCTPVVLTPTPAPQPSATPTVAPTSQDCVRATVKIAQGERAIDYFAPHARGCYQGLDDFLDDIGLGLGEAPEAGQEITFWTQMPVDSQGMLLPTATPTVTPTVAPADEACVRATTEIREGENPTWFVNKGPALGCYESFTDLLQDIGLAWEQFEPDHEITIWTQWQVDEQGQVLYPTPTPLPTATATPIGGASGILHIGDVTSHYAYSNLKGPLDGPVPVIIFVGHQTHKEHPTYNLSRFKDQFDEPVLLIRSGVLDDFTTDWCYFGPELCHSKIAQFVTLVEYYKNYFPIDNDRIYLTGFSCDSVYAHIFAYAHPELFAGVVAMSSNTFSQCLQENLDNANQVVTVHVLGELDETYQAHLALEDEHGRIIESLNPNSRWIVKKGETHTGVDQYWLENLKYIMQFSK
jgi:hypothetical protein